MGSGGFLITYFAAGIFGNVLGGNFALVGLPSVGASGAIFGTVAVSLAAVTFSCGIHFLSGDLGRSLLTLEVSIQTSPKGEECFNITRKLLYTLCAAYIHVHRAGYRRCYWIYSM
jgi:hypothetical protein